MCGTYVLVSSWVVTTFLSADFRGCIEILQDYVSYTVTISRTADLEVNKVQPEHYWPVVITEHLVSEKGFTVNTARLFECLGKWKTYNLLPFPIYCRYELQEDHSLLEEYQFSYDAQWFKDQIQEAFNFWRGAREPKYVTEEEGWKWKFCKIAPSCPKMPSTSRCWRSRLQMDGSLLGQ